MQLGYIFYVCVRSLSYPARRRMHRMVICGLSSSTFFQIVISGTILENVTENKTCVLLSLKLLFETFLVLRTVQDMVINVC